MSKRKKRLLWFETKHKPLISPREYARRVARNAGAAALLILVSLIIGMAGYRWTESMSWLDAYVNAAMILSGMGPMGPLTTWGGKLFAGTYALYSGLAVLIASGIILAPVLHRMLHRFHLEVGEESSEEDRETEYRENDAAGRKSNPHGIRPKGP